MAHKTDFKDALFEQRKYRMQSNPDGTVTPVDETEYSQEGDRVGAKYFNETGEALNDLENPIFEDYTSTVAPDPEIALGLIKSKASFKALFQNIKAALLGMVFKKNVLTSMEEVNANTDEDMVAGAMAVKELSRELAKRTSFAYEEITIGTWFGKTLYRKVIEVTSFAEPGSHISIDLGFTIDEIINIYGYSVDMYANRILNSGDAPYTTITLSKDAINIASVINIVKPTYAKVVLEYTKQES